MEDVPVDPPFAPGVGPYALVMFLGFLVGVFGHLVGSKVLIASGIAIVFCAVVVAPLVSYLSG